MFRTGVEKIVWQLKTRREPAGYVGLSVILIPPIGEGPRMREQKKPSIPPPPPSLSLFFEDGLELRGSLSLAEKPCRSFSTRARYAGRRRQLDEQHESPGETGSSYRLLVR